MEIETRNAFECIKENASQRHQSQISKKDDWYFQVVAFIHIKEEKVNLSFYSALPPHRCSSVKQKKIY